MSDYEVLLADACRLPLEARIQLIEALWDTVPEEAMPPLSSEWLAEIERRSMEYDVGGVETLSWDEVREEAYNRLKGKP